MIAVFLLFATIGQSELNENGIVVAGREEIDSPVGIQVERRQATQVAGEQQAALARVYGNELTRSITAQENPDAPIVRSRLPLRLVEVPCEREVEVPVPIKVLEHHAEDRRNLGDARQRTKFELAGSGLADRATSGDFASGRCEGELR